MKKSFKKEKEKEVFCINKRGVVRGWCARDGAWVPTSSTACAHAIPQHKWSTSLLLSRIDQIRQDALQPLQFPPGSFHPIFSFFLSETWMMKGITRK